MFQYLRNAVSGSSIKDPRNSLVRDEFQKKRLREELAAAIKALQKKHIGTDNVIERNDQDALYVCAVIEAIFLHGCQYRLPVVALRNMFTEGIKNGESEVMSLSFWDMLKEVTHSDVITQLKHLVVSTEVGLCRAWIRLALNDALLVSYLDAIVADRNLGQFYGPNAFLRDPELPGIMKELLQGLMQFDFQLNYNTSKLNIWDKESLQMADLLPTDEKLDPTGQQPPPFMYTDQTGQSTNRKASFVRSASTSSQRPARTNVSLPTSSRSSPLPAVVPDAPSVVPDAPASSLEQQRRLAVQARLEEVFSQDTTDAGKSTSKIQVTAVNASPPQSSTTRQTQSSDGPTASGTALEPASARLTGNRLGRLGWSGWSSSFEAPAPSDADGNHPEEDSNNPPARDRADFSAVPLNESFGSLLKNYTTGGVTPASDAIRSGNSRDVEDVDGRPASVTQQTDHVVPDDRDSPSDRVQSPNSAEMEQLNFEVVPMSSAFHMQYLDQKARSFVQQLTEIGLEVGLDAQSFRCKYCGKSIGLIYGPYRCCFFDGGYYCCDCHENEEHTIPSRVIQNWDFRRYKVSKYNNSFLRKIEEEPLFHIDEINPTLYAAVTELNEVKLLRMKLLHIKEYVQTCRQDVAEDFRVRLWPREYLSDDIHQYSLLDLIQVHTGQLAQHLKKIIAVFTRHIYKCTLCKEKGFICEYCKDPQIIYPFEVGSTVQCPRCLSVYHTACRQDRRCPKCVRMHLRTRRESTDDPDGPHDAITVTQRDASMDVNIGVL